MSKYPIGATWQAVSDTGKIGKIWLDDRNSIFEIWRWSVIWNDGSGYKFDWSTSYRKCVQEIPLVSADGTTPRMKRVK